MAVDLVEQAVPAAMDTGEAQRAASEERRAARTVFPMSLAQ